MRRAPLLAAILAALLLLLASPTPAGAAPRWVDRSMTLPRLVFAGDVGLGVAHVAPRGLANDFTGAGMNLEAGLGITDSVELGLRTGLRLGDEGRFLQADAYGRTLWTETYGVANAVAANPEFRVRWAAYSGRVVEVGLDGRVYTPFEPSSRFGVMMGVPLVFHAGDILRIDTGLYVPLVFTDQVSTIVSVPAYFWFQASSKVWLGPMTAFRSVHLGPLPSRTDFLLGFGVGFQVHQAVDLKWMLLFPRVNDADFRVFGAGFGVQFRIGE